MSSVHYSINPLRPDLTMNPSTLWSSPTTKRTTLHHRPIRDGLLPVELEAKDTTDIYVLHAAQHAVIV